MLTLVRQASVRFFQFAAFRGFSGLTHAVGCRLNGASAPPYDSMNLSEGVGDDPAAVRTNRNRWRRATGGGVHVYARQTHGTAVRVIGRGDRETGLPIQVASEPTDALMTNVAGICLHIQTADCQAVLLFDPEKRAVANIHCGWRGSVANLIGIVIARMGLEFGCNPETMLAAVGPSLGPCCAEFIHYEDELPAHLWRFRVAGTGNHFDFWRVSRHQLLSAGLSAKRVYQANACTRCNPHLFFSYRAAKTTGRCASFIGLRETDKP